MKLLKYLPRASVPQIKTCIMQMSNLKKNIKRLKNLTQKGNELR